MRSVFYAIYAGGATVSALCMLLLDPMIAIIVTMGLPILSMWVAEMTGYIHFVRIEQEDDDSILYKIQEEGLTDRQAIDKYGQQLINEVDTRIAHVEAQVMEMKRNRGKMAELMQGDVK
ncbi:hypothetical protein UFOVP229_17 [uncultured Caudovirales phage]|uniref:Uncharacterized protein n=1 Tax=uncultured Caudovirales phage TaxID=2100421 RepID=A0A6J7WUT8_9CAUD|nr:hypothetical protein UFOVP229_17 [uncultured Caudovirales phage]